MDNTSPQQDVGDIYDTPEYFSQRINSEQSRLFRAREQFVILEKYWQNPGNLLDVGSALGYFLYVGREKNWAVEGVEISAFASNYAHDRFGLDVHNGKLEDMIDELNPPYDVVSFLHVLEHVPDPLATLKMAVDLLSEDGGILIEVPDFGSKKAQKEGEDWHLMIPPEHLYYFSESTLRRYLTEIGLTVMEVKSISSTKLLGFTENIRGGGNVNRLIRGNLKYFRWIRNIYLKAESAFKGNDVIAIVARK